MNSEEFLLRVAPSTTGLRVHVSSRLAGEDSEPFEVPEGLASFAANPDASRVEEVGGRLFRALISGPVASRFDQCLGHLQGAESVRLRVKLQLDFGDPRLAQLHELPWETLFHPGDGFFVGLGRWVSFVRAMDVPRGTHRRPFKPPLRILCAHAGPVDLRPLDAANERQRIDRAWAGGGAEVTYLPRLDLRQLREALLSGGFHILHFIGHGAFARADGEGVLVFEREDGGLQTVTGRDLALQLQDVRSLRLVFLNACETARAAAARPFAGVATALLKAGIPAVLAMQREISDDAALLFSGIVYSRFAKGDSLDEAVTEGRLALRAGQETAEEWWTPALFLRTHEGRLGLIEGPASAVESPTPPVVVPDALPPWRRAGPVATTLTIAVPLIAWGGAELTGFLQRSSPRRTEVPVHVMEPARGPSSEVDQPKENQGEQKRDPVVPPPAPEPSRREEVVKPPSAATQLHAEPRPRPPTSPLRQVREGEPVYLDENGATVSVQFSEQFGAQLASVTVSAATGESQTDALQGPGSSLIIGTTEVQVVAIDFNARRISVKPVISGANGAAGG